MYKLHSTHFTICIQFSPIISAENFEKSSRILCVQRVENTNNIPEETQDKLSLYKYEYI